MAIPSRQIGGSTTTNLLWQISKQLEELICVRSGGCGSTTTTTTTICVDFINSIVISDGSYTAANGTYTRDNPSGAFTNENGSIFFGGDAWYIFNTAIGNVARNTSTLGTGTWEPWAPGNSSGITAEYSSYICPTTTTTTTGAISPNQFCVWSTDFSDTSGYNVATNTLVYVPIDNDLSGVVGMASTSTKLWKHDPLTTTIREWFISSYPAFLTYSRDITYNTNFPNFVSTSTIVAADNNTILTTLNATSETFPNGVPGSVLLWKYDISTNNSGNGTPVFGIQAAYYATAMIFTTDSKLIVSAYRLIDNAPVYYLTQYSYPDGLIEVDISLASIPFNPLASSSAIYPITYNGEIYLVRSNDSSLFKIETVYPYAITEVTADLGFIQERIFESSTGECNNISFTPQLPECGTTIPRLGETFTYFGVTGTVTTLSGGIVNYGFLVPGGFAECSALWQPPFYWVANGSTATIVLTFDSAINNVGIVLSILNLGDDFTITTNTEVPSITMSNSCYATVSGNQIITDPSITPNGGSGQFVITSVTPYTVLTIVATNGGNGGPIGLSCDPSAPTTTSTSSSTTTLAPTGFNTIYTHFESL